MGFSRPAKRPRTDASGLPDASPEALHSTVYRETRIEVIAADATTFPIASIVNAANTGLRGGGGIDGAIHNAAGPDLLAELKRVYPFGCLVGEAHPTDAHNIQTTQHIIHAVGPDYRRQVYRGNEERAHQDLHDAYTNSMQAAMDRGATSIAFPTISTGIFEFPPELASRIAMAAVRAFVDQQKHFRFERVVFLVWSPEGESPDLKHYNANFDSSWARRDNSPIGNDEDVEMEDAGGDNGEEGSGGQNISEQNDNGQNNNASDDNAQDNNGQNDNGQNDNGQNDNGQNDNGQNDNGQNENDQQDNGQEGSGGNNHGEGGADGSGENGPKDEGQDGNSQNSDGQNDNESDENEGPAGNEEEKAEDGTVIKEESAESDAGAAGNGEGEAREDPEIKQEPANSDAGAEAGDDPEIKEEPAGSDAGAAPVMPPAGEAPNFIPAARDDPEFDEDDDFDIPFDPSLYPAWVPRVEDPPPQDGEQQPVEDGPDVERSDGDEEDSVEQLPPQDDEQDPVEEAPPQENPAAEDEPEDEGGAPPPASPVVPPAIFPPPIVAPPVIPPPPIVAPPVVPPPAIPAAQSCPLHH